MIGKTTTATSGVINFSSRNQARQAITAFSGTTCRVRTRSGLRQADAVFSNRTGPAAATLPVMNMALLIGRGIRSRTTVEAFTFDRLSTCY